MVKQYIIYTCTHTHKQTHANVIFRINQHDTKCRKTETLENKCSLLMGFYAVLIYQFHSQALERSISILTKPFLTFHAELLNFRRRDSKRTSLPLAHTFIYKEDWLHIHNTFTHNLPSPSRDSVSNIAPVQLLELFQIAVNSLSNYMLSSKTLVVSSCIGLFRSLW